MPTNNENKYIDALNGLKSSVKNEEFTKVRIESCSLDVVEKIMDKMEWSLSTAINSCITYTISISKKISFSNFDNFNLSDEFESVELDLSVKNENRIIKFAEKKDLKFNERLISYVLTNSIQHFHSVIFSVDGVENE